MRKLLAIAGVLSLAACGGNPNVPPTVTMGYGSLSDGAGYQGPKPVYSFANGVGADVPVKAGTTAPKVSYGYGGDGMSNVTVQTTPEPARQQLAAPANPLSQTVPTPGVHS